MPIIYSVILSKEGEIEHWNGIAFKIFLQLFKIDAVYQISQ